MVLLIKFLVLIFSFMWRGFCSFTPQTSEELKSAIDLWHNARPEAWQKYGSIGYWHTSLVTNMSSIFYGAYGFNEDISQWDTSAVRDMSHMFHKASSFNQNIGRWNTSAVTDMRYMFYQASAFRTLAGGTPQR